MIYVVEKHFSHIITSTPRLVRIQRTIRPFTKCRVKNLGLNVFAADGQPSYVYKERETY